MPAREFQYQPSRWAVLQVDGLTTQADVENAFSSVDTSEWATTPVWDSSTLQVRWRQSNPYTPLIVVPVGGAVAVERPYILGQPAAPGSGPAQVIAYLPGDWSDTHVTYL